MIDGIINVYKEAGFTSFDVVAKLRGMLGQKKIGHTGTLDPDATGVLPVCLGKATKVVDLLTDWSKTYKATMLLGIQTDTGDISGKEIAVDEFANEKVKDYTEKQIKDILNSFLGKTMQIPPMYSALKVNGKKLYEYAREGKSIERQPREINITTIELLVFSGLEISFVANVSKGTYIRTLCEDIGKKLNTLGTMKSLERISVGIFHKSKALTLDQIDSIIHKDEEKELSYLLPYVTNIQDVFSGYLKVFVKEDSDFKLSNGNKLEKNDISYIVKTLDTKSNDKLDLKE
ncbi:MAG: tRNA pseudouridine(55) synthase TruB, partial [Lachnospiraceae bacterium]|nr:tRNA pseudouridine(55) synthase TruB [Lachnospiraceae bacterium]